MEILKFSEPPKRSNRSGSARKNGLMPMVTFGIAVLVLGGMSTTLAGTISLGTGNTVEFGQGVVTTAACDESIRVIPTSSFDTRTSGTDYPGFHVSQIQLSGIGVAVSDTSSATQISAGCLGKTFSIRGYDATGAVVQFYDNTTSANLSTPAISFKLSAETATAFAIGGAPTFSNTAGGITYGATGNWKQFTTLDPGSTPTNTGVVTISNFKASATLTRLTVETSQ